AGVAAPERVHGTSLKGAMISRSSLKRKSVYAQLNPDTKDHAMQGSAVRTKDFKYMSFSSGNRKELLFDLKHDPGETRDLSRSRSHAKVLADHRRLLREWGDKS